MAAFPLATFMRGGRGLLPALAVSIAVVATPSLAQTNSAGFAALPGWPNDHVADAVAFFAASCPKLDPAFHSACEEVGHVPRGDNAAARAFLAWAFRPALLGDVQFTGYFELDVRGSLTREGPYQWPLFRTPDHPEQYARADVLGGALAGRGLELVWLRSSADLYFVQLQGAARVHLTNGRVMRIGGDTQNGHASLPVADLFAGVAVANHDMSIPSLRAWSAQHPGDAAARIARDRAYFFFAERHIPASEGPTGALGVPLAPLRSVAVDPAHIRLGSFVWISTEISASHLPLQRMMLAQDTGEPIRGAAHVDIFFGQGDEAERIGGRQNSTGRVWVLLPK